ncbi:hypothetical protein Tco_0153728 [Tanacetum coccineum]
MAEARKKRQKRSDSPRTPSGSPPPPPPPSSGASSAPGASRASGSSQIPLPPPPSSSKSADSNNSITADRMTSELRIFTQFCATQTAWVIPTSHIPDAINNWANALATTSQASAENSLLEKIGDMQAFMKWYCQKMEEYHKMLIDQIDWANPEGDQVRIDISRPLPLNGPPGHGSGPALSISKMKVARYLDFGLELLVPDPMWINDVCTYDIIRTHMRILSVVRIKAYSRYGYDCLKEIILRRANYQEYTIAEKDFKNLYPSDFEDLNLLLLHVHLNHLRPRQRWDAKGFEYKHAYTIIELPCAVVFPVSNNKQKIMRFKKIYKFSDARNLYMPLNGDSRPEGFSETWNALLVVVYEILTTDYFREPNEHIISAFSLRSLKPKCAIESRAKRSSINLIRTLFHITCSSHNVKTRVIIRVLRIIHVVVPEHPSDTYVFTMKMEILLEPTSNKLMVGRSSHDLEVQVKMEMDIPRSSGVYFITACSYSTDTSNDLMKAQQKARILKLKRRYFEDYYSDKQYAVSIKEDTAYPYLHSPKTTEERRSIHRIQERQYAVFKLYGNKIFWKISNVIPTPRKHQYVEVLIRASRLKKVMANKGNKSSMETFVPNDKADYYYRITSITVNGKNAYELKGKFLDDLHNNAFSGTNGKDAVEHIEYYLIIIDPIKLPNVDHDKLRVVVRNMKILGKYRSLHR